MTDNLSSIDFAQTNILQRNSYRHSANGYIVLRSILLLLLIFHKYSNIGCVRKVLTVIQEIISLTHHDRRHRQQRIQRFPLVLYQSTADLFIITIIIIVRLC